MSDIGIFSTFCARSRIKSRNASKLVGMFRFCTAGLICMLLSALYCWRAISSRICLMAAFEGLISTAEKTMKQIAKKSFFIKKHLC